MKDGVITRISRKSGHYRPTQEFIEQFYNELIKNDVDLSKVLKEGGY